VPKARVLFDLPEPFLRDFVGRLLTVADADIEVVGEVADFATVEEALVECRPDVVVLSGARAEDVAAWYRAHLLAAGSRVAVLSADGRDAVVWRSSVERHELFDVRAQRLVDMLFP
jgi:hypothetical protein